MDFFSAAKERLNSAEVEVDTEVNPGSGGVNTGNTPVSTPSVIQTVNVIVPSPVKSQREGKAPMTSEDVQATQKTKEQIRQEEASLAEAMRLQALQDEKDEIQLYLDALLAKRIQEEQELSEQQQKRKAEVQEAAQNYQEESFTYKEEMAHMALSDSEVTTFSKSCLKNYETLKKQYDDLRIELNQSEFNLANYKRGLASVEERLVFYKKNKSMLCDQIAVLKRDALFNESEINALKIQIERLKKEKEINQFKIDNFENASKSLYENEDTRSNS
ncbi:hypothetical protein Tco_0628872 [Tanacetum coccineum]|uniref:Uncharacterized protein n=1 Tax=Tanacetum coccineum TaxID=301880 RepID=A0ABQ4WRI0_9ASTR